MQKPSKYCVTHLFILAFLLVFASTSSVGLYLQTYSASILWTRKQLGLKNILHHVTMRQPKLVE